MQIKLFISAIAAAAMASNAFAVEIKNGRLLSHKEWTTGSATASFSPGTKTLQDILRKHPQMKSISSLPTSVASDARPTTGRVGETIAANNDGFVFVVNDTEETREYRYTILMCAQKTDNMQECAYSFDHIELEAGGVFYASKLVALKVKFDKPGLYEAYGEAFVFTNSKIMSSYAITDITVT